MSLALAWRSRARTLSSWMVGALVAFGASTARGDDPPPTGHKPKVPIPQVAIGFSRLVVRIDGNDSIGVASGDFHVRLIERLRARGFHAVGAENLVFGKDETDRAQYLLGGTVREVTCNDSATFCRIGVEWQVLDVASDKVVYKVMSRAAARLPGGDKTRMAAALLDWALDVLIKRDTFRRALVERNPSRDEGGSAFLPATLAPCPQGHKIAQDAEDLLGKIVIIKSHDGFGSGFFVSSEGLILTAAHVVEDATMKIRTRDGVEVDAVPVRIAPHEDMALLRTVTPLNRRCMVLRTDTPRSGTEVYAAGAPASLALAFSLTRGIVSGYPTVEGRPLLQTDAPVNPGNSGGPIVDADGAALGVVSFKLVATKVEGIAFAVPTPRALIALGLRLGAATDPRLLTETASLAPPVADAASVDTPDPVPTMATEDQWRAEERAEEVAAARARAAARAKAEAPRASSAVSEPEATAAEEPKDQVRPSSAAILGLEWGGAGLAAVGTLVAVATYASDGASTTEQSFATLRTWNTVGWVAAGVGAGAFGLSFVLRSHAAPSGPSAPPSNNHAERAPSTFSKTELRVGPQGLALRGTF